MLEGNDLGSSVAQTGASWPVGRTGAACSHGRGDAGAAA